MKRELSERQYQILNILHTELLSEGFEQTLNRSHRNGAITVQYRLTGKPDAHSKGGRLAGIVATLNRGFTPKITVQM